VTNFIPAQCKIVDNGAGQQFGVPVFAVFAGLVARAIWAARDAVSGGRTWTLAIGPGSSLARNSGELRGSASWWLAPVMLLRAVGCSPGAHSAGGSSAFAISSFHHAEARGRFQCPQGKRCASGAQRRSFRGLGQEVEQKESLTFG